MFDYIKYFAMRQKEENLSCMEFSAFWWFLKRKHPNMTRIYKKESAFF